MRFLIAPNFANPYDQRMVDGLASALRALGHDARALPSPLSEIEASATCRELNVDVLLQINRFPPQYNPLPASVRHITWFQDVFPDTMNGARNLLRSNDLVYALGDPHVLGLNVDLPCFVGTLLTGVDESLLASTALKSRSNVDFSLCGFIPPPLKVTRNLKRDLLWYVNDTVGRVPLIGRSLLFQLLWRILIGRRLARDHVPFAVAAALRGTVDAMYRPLRGELDIHALVTAMQEVAAPVLDKKSRQKAVRLPRRGRLGFILSPYRSGATGRQASMNTLINYLAREYPRLLDRYALIQGVLAISRSVELYGPGWDRHEQFKRYHKGTLSLHSDLLDVFRRTRINLANNTHGLGLHSRTLECMAVGGFVFTHSSPHDTKPGGMLTSFEPGTHYGLFTPDNLLDEARRWLMNDDQRVAAGARAASMIRNQHLWRHRAEQILADLKR